MNDKEWEQQPEWHGNPELGLESYAKMFRAPNGRMIPVYVFGEGDRWNFCVSAGARSDLSYSSCHPLCKTSQQLMDHVDALDALPARHHSGSMLVH